MENYECLNFRNLEEAHAWLMDNGFRQVTPLCYDEGPKGEQRIAYLWPRTEEGPLQGTVQVELEGEGEEEPEYYSKDWRDQMLQDQT